MTVDEIKHAVLKSQNLETNILNFTKDQINEAHSLASNSALYISATPFDISENIVDIYDKNIRDLLQQGTNGQPFHLRTGNPATPTLHGLKTSSGSYKIIQIFRNGHIEFFTEPIKQDSQIRMRVGSSAYFQLSCLRIVQYTVEFFNFAKKIFDYLGLNIPIVINFALLKVQNEALPINLEAEHEFTDYTGTLDNICRKDSLYIPSYEIQTIEIDNSANYLLDLVWNAFGYEHVPMFNPKTKKFINPKV